MSASCCSPAWRRWLHKHAPFLFKICPGGNYHWRWDRWCYCRLGEYSNEWEGGIYDLRDAKKGGSA